MAGSDAWTAAARKLLPIEIFADPVLSALRSTHRSLSQTADGAFRYAAEVAPFAALETTSAAALRDLATLVAPGESVWIFGEDSLPEVDGLQRKEGLPCLQMVFPRDVSLAESPCEIEPMELSQRDEMLALIDLAYPGFFRRRTPEMGRYFGIRHEGQLIAMGGERLRMPGYAEISGVCTHPEHRNRGYAAALIGHLAQLHQREDTVSFLHVSAANRNAIALYERLGMVTARPLQLHRMCRSAG